MQDLGPLGNRLSHNEKKIQEREAVASKLLPNHARRSSLQPHSQTSPRTPNAPPSFFEEPPAFKDDFHERNLDDVSTPDNPDTNGAASDRSMTVPGLSHWSPHFVFSPWMPPGLRASTLTLPIDLIHSAQQRALWRRDPVKPEDALPRVTISFGRPQTILHESGPQHLLNRLVPSAATKSTEVLTTLTAT